MVLGSRTKYDLDAHAAGELLEAACARVNIEPVAPGVQRDEWAQERHRTEAPRGRRAVRLGDQRQPVQHHIRKLRVA